MRPRMRCAPVCERGFNEIICQIINNNNNNNNNNNDDDDEGYEEEKYEIKQTTKKENEAQLSYI